MSVGLVLKKLHRFSLFFSIHPFSSDYEIVPIYLLMSISFTILYLFTALKIFYSMPWETYNYNQNDVILYVYIFSSSHILSAIVFNVLVFKKIFMIKKFIHDVIKIDIFLQNMYFNMNIFYKHVFIKLLNYFLLGLNAALMDYNNIGEIQPLKHILLISPLILNQAILLEVFVFSETINKILDFLCNSRNKVSSIKTYNLVYKCCVKFYGIYSLPLIIILGNFLLILIMTTHFLSFSFTHDFPNFIHGCLWGIGVVYDLNKLTNIAGRTAKLSKQFTSKIYTDMISNKGMNDITVDLHLMMKHKIIFRPCGLFNVDNTLFHTIIWAATTYMVLLHDLSPE